MARWFLFLGAVNGFLAVACGAFAAHGLRDQVTEQALQTFKTGAEYQAVHALALLAIGLLASHSKPTRWLVASGWCLTVGILLFSGSLYALTLSGTKALGVITPFGGLLLLTGWFCLALAALRQPAA